MADAAPAAPPGASSAPADAFASGEFDAVAFINKLFPDESSLSGVDALVAKLRLRVRRVDDEILEAVRSQSAGGRRAKEDLAEARGAVFELASRIAEIKAKAERSESMVEDICKDVRRLDRAKRHLTGTITALRRLSMLVSAVEQLEQMAPRRQYRDSANLLEAVNELSAHFDGHADVPKIEKLQKQVADVSRSLRDAAFEDFHSTFQPTVIEQDPGAAARLADACLVVNALEPHVREELVGRVANGELTNYASVFDAGETERSGLENVERRYAWIKRNVRSKEQMWAVFPPEWRVAQLVCMSLCKLTRTHILEVLDATTRSRDVHATLRALHRTVEFEREMDEHFGVRLDGRVLDEETTGETGDEEEEPGMSGLSAGEVRARYAKAAREKELAKQRGGRALPMDSAAAALAKASFKGVISTVFEDHMDAYVELEERQLLELVDALANEETWGAAESSSESSASATGGTPGMTSGAGAAEKNASSGSASASDASDPGARSAGDPSVSSSSSSAAPTLPSAARLFLHIKKVFRRCSNLTRGKPLLALHGAFVRVARAYAGRLVDRAEASGRFLADVKVKRDPARIADEYRALCLILNTAEYCGSTLGPLKATVRRALRDEAALRDAMDGGPGPGASRGAEDDFAGVTTAALATLVEGVEHRTELIPGVKATNWAALEAVGDQSAHVNACEAALRLAAPTIRASTEATFHAYFCEKLAGTLAPKLYRAALDRRQKFSDAGAQQFLLDAHAVRTMLVDLPSMGTGGGGARDSGGGGGGGGGAYARLVAREMGAVEALLKIVLSPREGLAETFEALLPKASLSDFLAVCELKGMTKPEAARAAEGLRGRGAAESPRGARGGAGAGAEKNADASAADPPPPPPPPPPPRAASSAKPPEPLAAARAAHHARTGSGSAAGSAASSDARGRHARTGSGGGVFGGATMPNMPSVNFGAMFKPGSGSSINQMMEKAKEATQKAASGMKEMGEKAADETRKLGKRAGM